MTQPAHPMTESALPEGAEALLQRLDWTVLRRLDGLLPGAWRTLWRGSGVDLADLRPYQPHDDVRHIDWHVTARLQASSPEPWVRQFHEERDLCAWFLVDDSASLAFGSGPRTKRSLARELVGLLGLAMLRQGHPLGAVLHGRGAVGDRIDALLPARHGRRHLLQLLARLGRPSTAQPEAQPGTTQLAVLLQAAQSHIRRRSLVFVLSDFLSAPGWQAPLQALALRHDVIALRLWDPAEADLPPESAWAGSVVLSDPETGEQLAVDLGDAAFRQRYAEAAQAAHDRLLDALAGCGVDVLDLSTDDDLLQALLRCADQRRQRQRLPAAARLGAGAGSAAGSTRSQPTALPVRQELAA